MRRKRTSSASRRAFRCSGSWPTLVLTPYARRFVIVAGEPELKRWWRNLRTPSPVRLLVGGEEVAGTGHVVAEAERAALLPAYVERFPAAARKMGLQNGPGGSVAADTLANVAPETVVVVVKP